MSFVFVDIRGNDKNQGELSVLTACRHDSSIKGRLHLIISDPKFIRNTRVLSKRALTETGITLQQADFQLNAFLETLPTPWIMFPYGQEVGPTNLHLLFPSIDMEKAGWIDPKDAFDDCSQIAIV